MLGGKEDQAMKLRMLLLLSFMTLGLASARATDTAPFIEVWKSATGSCCGAWVKHLEANGFTVKVNAAEAGPLAALKREAGIGDKLASCHTAKIDDYVIEGHVPGTDIKRLIAERPEAIGFTVSGMPAGSPGIDQGAEFEPYDVLLIKKDGTERLRVGNIGTLFSK
jgi:hypothetical protein